MRMARIPLHRSRALEEQELGRGLLATLVLGGMFVFRGAWRWQGT